MSSEWTHAAHRAFDRAGRIANWTQADRIDPLHLLYALCADDSRAGEILAEHGLTREVIRWSHESESMRLVPDQIDSESSGPHSVPKFDNACLQIQAEARQQASQQGRQTEAGSEHLLVALAAVPSKASRVLEQFGIDADRLISAVAAGAGQSSEPIAVDIRIEPSAHLESERMDTWRILDASANRAREGLRVVEDFVRFTLDDAHLTEQFKQCRHALAIALNDIGGEHFLIARDTQADVGTTITTKSERQRTNPLDVFVANFKRLQEAVRTLEEFGKIISGDLAARFEKLRYRLYTIEKAVLSTHANRARLEHCVLYVLATRPKGTSDDSDFTIREVIAGGADIIQIREKDMPDRELTEYATHVCQWTRNAGAISIINDRPDLAVLSDADGVHVGQDDLSVRDTRRIVGPKRLVGVSTHTIEQARQAVLDGADYIGVGPVFTSRTKSFDKFAGLEFVRQVAAEITLPWFAIGGIDEANINEVLDAGATRIAVSSAICAAEDPLKATAALRRKLGRA